MKKLANLLAVGALLASTAACNSSENNEITIETSSAQILGFSLTANDKVIPAMDSVFFSIDQLTLDIFNADSLPVGSDITHLVPHINTAYASLVELHVPRPGEADTIYNYLTNPNDSIDFSNGPVRIRVVSADAQSTAVYKVNVNVHTVLGDTLVWSRLERASLPSRFNVCTGQHTASMGGTICCLTTYQGQYCIAKAEDPAGTWQYVTPAFGFTPDINTFSATQDALFILDKAGNLYTSADGASWSATGQRWQSIIGGYQTRLLGMTDASGSWQQVSYPSNGAPVTVASDFPVSGFSTPVEYLPQMGVTPQLMITGGRTAGGKLTAQTWGFDGNSWAKISVRPLPKALENLAVTPYFVVKTNRGTWRTTRSSVLMAMFGNLSDGTPNDTIYISRDFGMNWTAADTMLQTCGKIPARTRAQAFTAWSTLEDKPAASAAQATSARTMAQATAHLVWTTVPGTVATQIFAGPAACATTPITQWQCPFIYVFGGEDVGGTTYNTLYRGVITQLLFKPLQ